MGFAMCKELCAVAARLVPSMLATIMVTLAHLLLISDHTADVETCRVLSWKETLAPILLLLVLPQSKKCPAQPLQPPCNFSAFPSQTELWNVWLLEGRLYLSSQIGWIWKLGRQMQVRHCHTYVILHIHIPLYTSIFLCQKKKVTCWYQIA